MDKDLKLREAAEKYVKRYNEESEWIMSIEDHFIVGAKSDAAKEYHQQLSHAVDVDKVRNDAYRFIVQGYYNRIVMNRPDIETVIEWLHSDMIEINSEDLVSMAKEILKINSKTTEG